MSRNPLRVDSFHPTIGSAYHAVEGYLEHLAVVSGDKDVAQPLALPPIDALLIHLVASFQSVRPYVVDLAASPTWGVSTLLCRTDSSIRQVVTCCAHAPEYWEPILDRYLRDWNFPLVECVKIEGGHEALGRVHDPQDSILIISAAKDTAAFESWLEAAPKAAIVLLGIEKTGDSSYLASLAVRCTGSPYRLALPRELAPALVDSRLALVSRRDNVVFESMLARIERTFANQFQFLDLIKRICDSALEESVFNEPLSTLRAGTLEPQSLITTYDLRRTLVEREQQFQAQLVELRQELQDMRQSLTYRILQSIRRLSRFFRFERTDRQLAFSNRHTQAGESPTNSHLRPAS